MQELRHWLFRNMDASAWSEPGLSPINRVIVIVVLASVATVVLETEETVSKSLADYFRVLNICFAALFTF